MINSIEIYVGQSLSLEQLAQKLMEHGYTRLSKVVKEGEFSVKGATLDVFPANFETPIRVSLDDQNVEAIFNFDQYSGQIITQHNIVIVLPYKQARIKGDIFDASTPIDGFVDIEAGDYVVHNQHGIGKYLGIEKIFRNKETADHLVIEYDGGDKLFVPRHDIRLVQKYVSFHKRPPKLYRLGSKEWQKTKLMIQQKLERVAAELLRIQALRASLSGHAFKKYPELEEEFAREFPFEETPDQAKAIEAVMADMESPQPMDRLICADVGYGKTEVALRAAFKCVIDGKQAAILVPTTILAEQHFYNFKKRFQKFPVNVQMLSRFRTREEQKKIVQDLRDGKVDVIIGTHRLLSKDVGFKDLGLIVVDEEQRFGVKSKERLKHFRLLADVLTMTATPIPRTLHMAMTGAKDMSVIMTPPSRRMSIQTQVIGFNDEVIAEAIQRELDRKGQVFFLHNRVEDIERVGKIVNDLVPEARVEIAHGQMSSKVLEDIMIRFLEGQIDVLVCTTIIESGLDIPNANTLIVDNADHLGLSEMHQLRGRVGRSTRQAYAYLIVPNFDRLPHESQMRIRAIEKYSGLGAGFQIAMEDLQLRGAGNLLGEEQSGYIASVGFDLYCRLLKESVEHLKKEIGGSLKDEKHVRV